MKLSAKFQFDIWGCKAGTLQNLHVLPRIAGAAIQVADNLRTIWRLPKDPRGGLKQMMAGSRNTSTRLVFRHWFKFVVALVLTLLLHGGQAQGEVSHESQLKAVFLYNFTHYTDWPVETLGETNTPMVIGILGKDPVMPYVEEAVRGEKVNDRPLVSEHFSRVGDIKDCQVLFISASEARRLPEILEKLRGKSVLTVSDMESFTDHGGMVRFVTVNNKIQLRINMEALKTARLTMSSKLLRLAEIDSGTNK